jgi:RNA polymerase primary sigma factor
MKAERNETKITDELEETVQLETGLPDSVKAYLREIGRFPLLTAEEEQMLSLRVRAGQDGKNLLAEEPGLDPEQRETCLRLVRQGKEAQQTLVNANLRLVVTIAKKYLNRGLPLLDLIQEGNLGLMKAAERYDGSTGNRFSTCAAWWIRQGISRAVTDTGRAIRLPSYMVQDVSHLRQKIRQLSVQLDREPTVEELAQSLGISPKKVQDLMRFGMDTTSLDVPVGEDDATLAEFVGSVTPMDEVDDRLCQEQLHSTLNAMLEGLPQRDRLILTLHYGLKGQKIHTLDEIGQQLGLTRERVRQLEIRALRQLRKGTETHSLQSFIA